MMPETCWDSVHNKHLIVASCWFSLSLSLSSQFAYDAGSQKPKPLTFFFLMVSFKTHTSQPYVTVGLIILQYSFNSFLDARRKFHRAFYVMHFGSATLQQEWAIRPQSNQKNPPLITNGVWIMWLGLPLQCQWGNRSSGMLRSVRHSLVTDVSLQPVGPIFKDQAVFSGLIDPWDETDRSSLNVGKLTICAS